MRFTIRDYTITNILAVAIFIAVFAALAVSINDVGMAWDEGIDVQITKEAVGWFGSFGDEGVRPFSRPEIEKHWSHEWIQHPSATRIFYAAVYGISSKFGGGEEFLKWKAYRYGSFLLFAGLAAVVFLAGTTVLKSNMAGVVAAAALVFMPRMLGHAHIVETDLMLAAVCFAAAMAFLRGLESSRAAVLFGILAGLLPAVKFTGFFILASFFLWGLIFRRSMLIRNAVAAALIAPVVFYAVQPMYWHAPAAAFNEYATHFLQPGARSTISTCYFGKYYSNSPPWSYPLVMTLASIPVATIALSIIGASRALLIFNPSITFSRSSPGTQVTPAPAPVSDSISVEGKKQKEHHSSRQYLSFFLMNAVFTILIFMPERVAMYDGERLLMPVFPFWALLAGAGFHLIAGRLKPAGMGLLLIIFVALVGGQTFAARPFYLTYYNEIIGGPTGAYERGLEVIYWGEAFGPEFAELLNRKLPPGPRISTIGYYSGNLRYFQDMGLLRRDFEIVNYGWGKTDFLLVFNRAGVLDQFSAALIKNYKPLIGLDWKGVRLAGVYGLKPN